MNPGHKLSWLLATPPAPVAPGVVTSAPLLLSETSYLGHGLGTPFTRVANDFHDAEDLDSVKSALGQILGTRAQGERAQGELHWRPEFGSLLYQLRHRNQTAGFRMFATHFVRDAVARWEPRIRVVDVSVVADPRTPRSVVIRVVFHVLDRNVASNRVIFPNQTLDLPLAA